MRCYNYAGRRYSDDGGQTINRLAVGEKFFER
jgi:hypothetical protein